MHSTLYILVDDEWGRLLLLFIQRHRFSFRRSTRRRIVCEVNDNNYNSMFLPLHCSLAADLLRHPPSQSSRPKNTKTYDNFLKQHYSANFCLFLLVILISQTQDVCVSPITTRLKCIPATSSRTNTFQTSTINNPHHPATPTTKAATAASPFAPIANIALYYSLHQ